MRQTTCGRDNYEIRTKAKPRNGDEQLGHHTDMSQTPLRYLCVFPLFLPCLEFFHSMNDFLLAGIVTLAYPILIADPTEAVDKDYSLRSLPSGVQVVSSLNLCFFGVHDQEVSLARGQHHLPSFAFLHSSWRELPSMPCFY